uniref:Uncharacterized protein n=1 Tax=Romanomermis culicivorax TaxID=13658 RepID=A0A915IDB9_ROMCU
MGMFNCKFFFFLAVLNLLNIGCIGLLLEENTIDSIPDLSLQTGASIKIINLRDRSQAEQVARMVKFSIHRLQNTVISQSRSYHVLMNIEQASRQIAVDRGATYDVVFMVGQAKTNDVMDQRIVKFISKYRSKVLFIHLREELCLLITNVLMILCNLAFKFKSKHQKLNPVS